MFEWLASLLLWCPIFSKCFEKLIKTHSTLCSLHTGATASMMMPLLSPYTLLSPIWTVRTPMWECLFMDYSSAFNTIVPARLVMKLQTDSGPKRISVQLDSGVSADVRWSEWVTLPHLHWSSTLVLLRAAFSAHSYTPCTHTTVQPHTAPTS